MDLRKCSKRKTYSVTDGSRKRGSHILHFTYLLHFLKVARDHMMRTPLERELQGEGHVLQLRGAWEMAAESISKITAARTGKML